MRQDTWKAIEEMFERFPFMCAEPVELEEISAASDQLGIPFVEDYRDFVHRYGGAIVGPYRIYGLRRAEAMGENERSVVDVTLQFRRQQWPGTQKWIVFSTDHGGNPIGFDMTGVVWTFDHDSGREEITHDCFETYLRKRCLKMK